MLSLREIANEQQRASMFKKFQEQQERKHLLYNKNVAEPQAEHHLNDYLKQDERLKSKQRRIDKTISVDKFNRRKAAEQN